MEGAQIQVGDSIDTSIRVDNGSMSYEDYGTDTSIHDGGGDSVLLLSGHGQVMANAGAGDDTFVVSHQGSAIIAGGDGADSFHFVAPGGGNAVILDWDPQQGDTGPSPSVTGQLEPIWPISCRYSGMKTPTAP